jgi:hypothetical protein
MEDHELTDKERQFLERKKRKDKATSINRIKENLWLKEQRELSEAKLPNEFRSKFQYRKPFQSYNDYYDDDYQD